jgi:hypothetical protein
MEMRRCRDLGQSVSATQGQWRLPGRGGTLSLSAHAQGRPASVETTHESPYDIVLPGRGCLISTATFDLLQERHAYTATASMAARMRTWPDRGGRPPGDEKGALGIVASNWRTLPLHLMRDVCVSSASPWRWLDLVHTDIPADIVDGLVRPREGKRWTGRTR